MNSLFFVALFVSVTLLTLAAYSFILWLFVSDEYKVGRRLSEMAKDRPGSQPDTLLVFRDDQYSRIPLFNRLLEKLNFAKQLRRLIDQSGISVRVGELVLLMAAVAALGFLAGNRLHKPVVEIGLAALGGILPLAFVFFRRKKRWKLFLDQFPDSLDMMTSALRAGHGLGRALQLVADEAPDPIGTEFRKTYEEQNLGLPQREALLNLAKRVEGVDVKLFATAVMIQRETGGNLTEILAKISETIRERFKLLGHIRVITAQGRISGWILGLLPVIVAFIISIISPDYIMALFKEPLGRLLVIMAVSLQILGFLIIRKIIRINVY